VGAADAADDPFRALRDPRPHDPARNAVPFIAAPATVEPRVLIAGDSWAQYMWDDGSHNDILDKFGHGEKRALALSLTENPGPGYTGPEYAVSGSEARNWVDSANYPWIQNMVAALEANPSIDTVVLSVGGNDILAGKPGGGWYKDMDLDVPGSEAALFNQLEQHTFQIIQAALAVRPEIRVMISSYDYPNFNVGFLCFISACPMRRNLSRDPDNDLVTDAELNALLVTLEQLRIGWANSDDRILYDNSLGLMHHYYGDGVTGAGILPHPGQTPPLYEPFPGGNPLRPSLRENFRRPGGFDVDPIHLDYEGYQYKITNQTQAQLFPHFRGAPDATFFSEGGNRDGWSDGTASGTGEIRFGRDVAGAYQGIVSFDTSTLPEGVIITQASLYLHRDWISGGNPLQSGALGLPRVDMASGSFGAPELESGDAHAAADVLDAGFLSGSALRDGYAIRVEITGTGLAAVNTTGTTQFRIGFPDAGAGTTHFISFGDGDAMSVFTDDRPTLSEYIGTAAPFLDVAYATTSDVQATLGGVVLRPGHPNPFAGATTLRFVLPGSGHARLVVYDVAGRRVATLLDRALPAGGYEARWDGRHHSGAAAAAGVYWARLVWGNTTRVRQLVLLGR
jgi:hypothetical protein